jgi:formylglycine-generating enzyme required for sulfatase activity
LSVTDSNNKTFTKSAAVTIYPDPLTAEQEVRNVNGVSFAMRYISPGSFTTTLIIDNTITVDIDISKGYWMSETEVTQELYQSVMGYNPSMYNDDPALGENQNKRPIENISLIEAKVFCNRLSQLSSMEPVYQSDSVTDWLSIQNASINSIDSGSLIESPAADGFRIPSENEWQWAAFGADIGGFSSNGYKKYYSGGPIESWDGFNDHVWYFDNSDWRTHEVGIKSANEAGIYDMSGNVLDIISNGKAVGGCAFFNENQIKHLFTYQADITYPQNPHSPAGIRLVSNR